MQYTHIHQCHAETVFTAVSVEQNQRWWRLVDMLNMTACPCIFLLTAPGSCHPNAILPAFITCWTAQHVTGKASWRVTGLINPVWQLPDALSGSSPPLLSRSHIPVSRGPITSMIYSMVSAGARLQNLGSNFFLVYFLGNFILYWHMAKLMAFLKFSQFPKPTRIFGNFL